MGRRKIHLTKVNLKRIVCFLLFLGLFTTTTPCIASEPGDYSSGMILTGKNSSNFGLSYPDNIQVKKELDYFFEIQFVSPDLLNTIVSNSDTNDEILKVGPGMVIGVSTPKILYLRGDLQSDDYLIKNRNTSDMKEKISEHLVDLAFGRDNHNISILKKDLDYKIWFDSIYTSDDINTTLAFTRFFNELSSTTQFEDEEVSTGELMNNYGTIPYNYYNIKIVPKQYLEDYKDDKYDSSRELELKGKNGDSIGFLTSNYVYLWDGLTGKDRSYYILKSLLWSLGLHGETTDYPDSFFYTKANGSATLSSLDIEAIKLLYGGRLSSDMTKDEVRKALDISKG